MTTNPDNEPDPKPNEESMQSKGGKARARKLTPEQLAESARKAAEARWAQRPMRATHKGNFKEEFGIDVDCYVLDDQQKTPVLSQRGFTKALGLSEGGSTLGKFLASKKISEFGGAELIQKLTQPVKFEWGTGGAEMPPSTINGFDATLLIDICKVITSHRAELGKRYENVIIQADVINAASAKSGIRGLVYALAGYSPAAEEVIAAFKMYVQEEAKKYEKEFPPELYKEWYRLYEIEPIQGRGRPWEFKKLTVNHIYVPLAKSRGKILEVMQANKAKGGDRKRKLLQFLSEIGTRALRMHLGRVLEMAEDSPDQATYEKRITKRFGDQQELDF